jgi:hypothetical protein
MDCCIKCFDDQELKFLIATKSTGIGNCSFCGSKNEAIASVANLQLKFEFLLEFMEECEEGFRADILIDEFFCVFSAALGDNKLHLLDSILDTTLVKKSFKSKWDRGLSAENWNDLRNEIIFKNRYFPQSDLYRRILQNKNSADFAVFLEVLDRLESTVTPSIELYRARISDIPLLGSEMGAPPNEMSTSGRANPFGISYLYLASLQQTAISEVRPYNDGIVYVSPFKSIDTLTFIDLTNPRSVVSPFGFSSENYESLIYCLSLLEQFSKDLSKPVKPHKSELEYVPTQFICEYIKSLGAYSGIIFNSSFGPGVNYVVFDSKNFTAEAPIPFKIIRTHFEHELI